MSADVVVTGANGLVGAEVCRALVERGVPVRGIVRRAGSAPAGVSEVVGEFHDQEVAARACDGARVVIHTVHPMGEDDLQVKAPEWTRTIAQAASTAGAELFIQVSTTSVYRREADTGDVDEDSELVADDVDNIYSLTKRQSEEAVAEAASMTRVLVRPTAILGASDKSIWNAVRPRTIRDGDRAEDPDRSWGFVHVVDLAALIADLATGAIPAGDDPATGPLAGGVSAVNAVTETRTMRDFQQTVCDALGVEPQWETRQAFRAELRADRARAWGWWPRVGWELARRELIQSVQSLD